MGAASSLYVIGIVGIVIGILLIVSGLAYLLASGASSAITYSLLVSGLIISILSAVLLSVGIASTPKVIEPAQICPTQVGISSMPTVHVQPLPTNTCPQVQFQPPVQPAYQQPIYRQQNGLPVQVSEVTHVTSNARANPDPISIVTENPGVASRALLQSTAYSPDGRPVVIPGEIITQGTRTTRTYDIGSHEVVIN